MCNKNKIVIILLSFVIFFAVLGGVNISLKSRHWKYIYFGKNDGFACEVLYAKTPYKTVVDWIVAKFFFPDNDYYREVWIKTDKSVNGIFDVSVDNCAPYPSVPPDKWVKIDSKTYTPSQNPSMRQDLLLNLTYRRGISSSITNIVTIKLKKTGRPPFIPPCRPKAPDAVP